MSGLVYGAEATKRYWDMMCMRIGTDVQWAQAMQLLKDGANPNQSRDARVGRNILHDATYAGGKGSIAYDTLVLALERGAELQAVWISNKNKMPLHDAVAYGHPDVVALFLEKGAPVHATDSEGNTPLHVFTGYADARHLAKNLLLLIRAGADLSARGATGEVPAQVWVATTHQELLMPDNVRHHPKELLKIYPYIEHTRDTVTPVWEKHFDVAKIARESEPLHDTAVARYVRGVAQKEPAR